MTEKRNDLYRNLWMGSRIRHCKEFNPGWKGKHLEKIILSIARKIELSYTVVRPVTLKAVTITALLVICCCFSFSQLRITGAAGLTNKPTFAGQLNVAYNAHPISAQVNLLREGLSSGTYIGINSGIVIQAADDWQLQPYTGIALHIVGNSYKQDRYIHNRSITILTDNREINSWTLPIGMQIIRDALFIDAGAYVGKETKFFLTIGITHLFE